MRPSSRTAVVYASDWFNDVVDVFAQSGSKWHAFQRLSIDMTQPSGIATDRDGNLWVAQTLGNGAYAFDLSTLRPVFALDDAGHEPYAIAIDRAGDAYLANTFDLEDAGFVNYYPAGSQEASYRITDPSFEYLYGLAVDGAANLYVSYLDASGDGAISKFSPGSQGPGQNLGLEPGSYFGMAFDRTGNLLVANYGAGEIDVFAPGAHKPAKRFGHRGRPWSIAFNRGGTRLFVADFERNQLEEYSYPAGVLVGTIPGEKGGEFVGVATGP
ncbi:MAG TPA: hypothetical protein VGI19_04385 [Candidatus Cybelea sp.]|jgi:DNA-binding beta-propeller fold protein YncE